MRKTDLTKTIFKIRVRGGTRSTVAQFFQLCLIVGALVAIMGLLAFGQYHFCQRDYPGTSALDCFSGAVRAKGKR